MGPYDIGDRNNRGETLLQFAQEKGNNTKNKQAQQEVDLDITGRSWQKYNLLHISTEELAFAVQQCRIFQSADISK